MKKIKILSLLFALLLISGCGSNDGTAKLEEALENMKNVESGTIGVDMNVNMDGYILSMNMNTSFTKEGDSYSKSTSSILGSTLTTEVYTEVVDDMVYIYTSNGDGNWYYEVMPKEEYKADNNVSMDAVGIYAENYKSVKEVNSDRKGHDRLEVVVDKDKFAEAMDEDPEVGDAVLNLTDDLTMYIYIKDGYVTGLKMDFADMMKLDESESTTNYTMDITISDHNKIDSVIIPDAIKDNAKLLEDEE